MAKNKTKDERDDAEAEAFNFRQGYICALVWRARFAPARQIRGKVLETAYLYRDLAEEKAYWDTLMFVEREQEQELDERRKSYFRRLPNEAFLSVVELPPELQSVMDLNKPIPVV